MCDGCMKWMAEKRTNNGVISPVEQWSGWDLWRREPTRSYECDGVNRTRKQLKAVTRRKGKDGVFAKAIESGGLRRLCVSDCTVLQEGDDSAGGAVKCWKLSGWRLKQDFFAHLSQQQDRRRLRH